ncbi:hypothetical protein T492DRAFT_887382 [Pavlovales sp. CCMP2436]|nr:hypothetical protein T492DRAFT_887382 [Pavlovales sp. CCMP2436]
MHQDDSDDDMGGSSLLFSDKQIPELALYYPDYGRLKTLVNELALGGSGTSALRSSIDMKRTSSSSAERVAAAGSGEVEFRTALDTELSRVNQFVVQSSAELRAHVSDLDKDSMDFGRNVNELKATAQRCMKQVMQLDDFSSLSQSIFLRILNEHDAVSDVPMLLQFSQKLFYQPFMQVIEPHLAGPLATIESRLEARTSDAEEEAAAFESTSKSGLEMPLLTKRQNTLTHIKVCV